MNSLRFERYEYIKKIGNKFPYTCFCWFYFKEGNMFGSKHRTFKDSDEFSFLRKGNYYRTTLFNETSDELRLDLDYESKGINISKARLIIESFFKVGINNFEVYLSGGKGIHICVRFNIKPFENLIECGGFDRQELREAIFKALEVNVKVDKLLFRTQQVIGLEGYNHRKTNRPKQRIKIDYDSYSILEEPLNFEYLEGNYINEFQESFIKKVKDILNNKKSSNLASNDSLNINWNQISNYDIDKFKWEVKRFEEIYHDLKDGKKRVFDSLTRFLIARTKNLKLTKEILSQFRTKFNIECNNLDVRIKSSKIAYEKYRALFPYKDLLSKQYFYKGWPWAENYNEPLLNNN